MKDWINKMIERECLPKALRIQQFKVAEFCKENGISEETYYYQARKKENQEKILELSLNLAKAECPEILKVLTDKAKDGDMRAIDTYLDSVIKLAKNLDVKSDGKPMFMPGELMTKNGISQSTEDSSKEQQKV